MTSIAMIHRAIMSWMWPITETRFHAQFTSSWTNTRTLLFREVACRRTDEVIVEVDAPNGSFRRDGELRADARLTSPRVVVTFEDPKHGWIRYHADQYLHWHDNVRAIAKTMEALRGPERWGVIDGEQYHGLRSGRALSGKVLSSHDAAKILFEMLANDPDLQATGWATILESPKHARRVIRSALKVAHPDGGGDEVKLTTVQACRDVLVNHHGQQL